MKFSKDPILDNIIRMLLELLLTVPSLDTVSVNDSNFKYNVNVDLFIYCLLF